MKKYKPVNMMSKKIKIIPFGNDGKIDEDVYRFISDSIYAQYQALNRSMSFMMCTYYKYKQDFKNEEYKQEIKDFKINNTSEMFSDIEFGQGVDTTSLVYRKIKNDFSNALKDGLAKGERRFSNYKRTYPLMTRRKHLRFYYGDNNDIYIKWVHNIIFKVVIGRKDKDYVGLMQLLNKVINEEYRVGQSSIQLDKKGLILNLSYDTLIKKEKCKDNNNIMGIDLGINIPAYASLGNNTNIRQSFGSKDEFLKTREQFKDRRRRAWKQVSLAKGGKGRKGKLSGINRLKDKESNWAKTYNHQLSKKIIEFAIKNNVGQINMEKLEKDGFDGKLLGVWSYFQLQQMIEYKADREGILVKYINPAYTSQKCHCCGHTSKDNRPNQETFKCTKCGMSMNADRNASINIARSIDYVDKSKKKAKKKEVKAS